MMRRVGLVALFVLVTPGGASPSRPRSTTSSGSASSCSPSRAASATSSRRSPSNLFGPALSKDSAGGRDDVMREVIMNGTPRMPGFKYHFEPPQIDAMIAYLKTVPTPPPATPR